MPKSLSASAVARYNDEGIYFPVPVLSREEAAEYLRRLEMLEAREGGRLSPRTNQKPHLLLTWLDRLIRHPRILDAVEDLIGPDILCWGSGFFSKSPGDRAYVSWHQDGNYWGLSSAAVTTAWVAFTPSERSNGCMRVVPGSQKQKLAHCDTFAEDNLLSRGQEIEVLVDDAQALDVVLAPGEMSLHHVQIVHGSEPNNSDIRRIGFAIRYLPAHVHQANRETRGTATLVHGVDNYGHFDLEHAPQSDYHPQAVKHHAAVLDRQLKLLYEGAAKPGKLGATIVR
jgi:non-heme Fe2+,alpha-ketoglutarate-dependent halogenase